MPAGPSWGSARSCVHFRKSIHLDRDAGRNHRSFDHLHPLGRHEFTTQVGFGHKGEVILQLLFALLILGIGLLIIIYARFYLSKEDPAGQFYTYLMLFQGAMVGIVLSDNILLLLIFWELTSLSSFLLIGYWKHLPEGRQGARMGIQPRKGRQQGWVDIDQLSGVMPNKLRRQDAHKAGQNH